jgi:hypothetical protein
MNTHDISARLSSENNSKGLLHKTQSTIAQYESTDVLLEKEKEKKKVSI